MKIEFADIALLNTELKQRGLRYRLHYKNEQVACIEPPGECCLTEDMRRNTLRCIREYYESRRISVRFFDNDLYFACEDLPEDQTP